MIPSKFSNLLKSRSVLLLLILTALLAEGCKTNSTCIGLGCSIQVSVTIDPHSTQLAAGGTYPFKVHLENLDSSQVVWKVHGIAGGNSTVGTITSTGVYTAPVSSYTEVKQKVTAYIPDIDISDDATVTVLAAHNIGVRQTTNFPEFTDNATGRTFVPRGNNYIRLASLTDPNGNTSLSHSTFNVGLYDGAQVETALTTMQASGYNVVRVFLQGCCQNTIGDPSGGLSGAYLGNVADFLRRARAHAIYVIITSEWLPAYGGYNLNCPQYPMFDDVNLFHLCAGTVATTVQFWHDFVNGLIAKGAPLQAILAYELVNEYFYNSTAAPLSWTNGTVSAANGQAYDMGSSASRQQMMDDGLIYFTNQIRGTIIALDPTALVTVGFFVPQGPNPTRIGDTRVIQVYPAIASSTADFVDLHAYPLPGDLTLDQIVQNFGFVGFQQQKPVMMAEFGGFKSEYATAADAATGLSAWQSQSCTYHFDGWALWTWDTDEQTELWTATSSSEAIGLKLGPAAKVDPCSP
jgi:hypothetical protein